MRKRIRIPGIYRRGRWYYFRTINSFGKRVVIKSLSQREAMLKREGMLKQLFSAASEQPTYRVEIGQGIDFWLSSKKGRIDESSYLRYRGCMDNFRNFLSLKRPDLKYFDEVLPEYIREFMEYRLSEKHRATKTINVERMALNNLFSVLIEHNKIPADNPVTKIKAFKVIKIQKRRCLSDDELVKFLEGAKVESGSIDWYAMYFTLYVTGMRRDEVRKLEKKYVDLSKGLITILDTKTDKPKIIPIHPQLRPVLKKAIEQHKGALVFPNSEGRLLHKNKLRDKMHEICEKVGIEKATVHDLRHTFASRQGLPDRVKQIIGGWSSKQVMEKTYIHTPEDYVRDEYFKVDFMPKSKD
jgi:integrase